MAPHDLATDARLGSAARLLTGFFTKTGNANFAFSAGRLRAGLAESAIELEIPSGDDTPREAPPRPDEGSRAADGLAVDTHLVRVTFPGSRAAVPVGQDGLPQSSNFFMGSDPSRWRTGAESFREVAYPELYPGVDLVVKAGGASGLKYEFEVRPGADPSSIEVAFEGADAVQVGADGGLELLTPAGALREGAPYSYEIGGFPVMCGFALRTASSYGFACGARDSARVLVIDPLVYSSYLGGSQLDRAWSLAVDADGNAYVAGETVSPDFPTTAGAIQTTAPHSKNAFVAKIDPTGTKLLFATYLGGDGGDAARSVALAPDGDIVVSGSTGSLNFPITAGAFDASENNGTDAFLLRLSADGRSLLSSTYFGGSGDDNGNSVAVDAAGGIYLAGETGSADLPVTPLAPDQSLGTSNDLYVAAFSADASSLRYATFVGGTTGDEFLGGVTVDSSGAAMVTGSTLASDFPVTAGAFDTTYAMDDGFVTKLSPAGDRFLFSTFLGGSATDVPWSVDQDSAGNAFVVGWTQSLDFPTTPGAFDVTYAGGVDAFLVALNASGDRLQYSTYFGGSDYDGAVAVAFAPPDSVIVAGQTFSPNFPVTPFAEQTSRLGPSDGFLSRWRVPGPGLVHSTLVGGGGGDWVDKVAVDPDDHVYFSGLTFSANFPLTTGALDARLSGDRDGYIAELDLGGPPPSFDLVDSPGFALQGASVSDGTLYLGGAGAMRASTDAANWTQLARPGAGKTLSAVAAWNGALYASESDPAGGSPFTIVRSTNGGQNWSLAVLDSASGPVDAFALAPFNGFLFAASCGAFTSGGQAALYRTADGSNWGVVNASLGLGVCSSQSMVVWRGALYAALLDGAVLRTDDGVAWQKVASFAAPMTFIDAGQSVYLGTYRGGSVHKSTDGLTWTLHAGVPSAVETWAGDAWNGSIWWAGRAGSGPASGFVANLTGPQFRNIYVDASPMVGALAFLNGRLVLGNSAGEIKAAPQVRERGPQLAFSSAAVAGGVPFGVSLEGLAPGAPIGLRALDGKGRHVLDISLTADARGEASFQVRPLANWTTGNYTFTATGESPARQLNGSYIWTALAALPFKAQPSLVVELAQAPARAAAGSSATWSLRLTNNLESDFSGIASVGWQSPNLTPMLPAIVPVNLAAGDDLVVDLRVFVPASAAAGTYTVHVLVLTGLPRDGGSALFSATFALEVA